MSLSAFEHCPQCDCVLNYRDAESGVLYVQQKSHTDDDCALMVRNLKQHLKQEIIRLNKLVTEEQMRAKEEIRKADNITRMVKQRVEELTINLVKAPADQKTKLIKQCQRWQALYERERYKRWELKKQIMHVYGTLDFRMETGCIVDPKGKVVAEYVSNKLREILRKATR